ncbi:Rne/Rng family ribonuclease [Propionivibrio sp.]|uniref:Rne/Rng family ribonuclease n=1 Tax=Propionivibrio sp. TaxID=2212460 RepID=UPI002621843F|nr:Rne/Rng family ribonuclease [Propionivibrio sp.]
MKRMLFNATQAEELRVAIVDGQKLVDLDIESAAKEQKKSNIYKAVITRIEPSLEAAFVDYGAERHGFLPFKEISRAYFQPGVEANRATIKEALREGQELIVQVDKDERGNKGAALTTFVSLAGRYLVLMPNNPRGGGVSRRVEGDERAELRDVMDQLQVPQGMSLIARTAAIGRNAEELQWDLNYLMQLWKAIDGAANQQKGAFLIYQEGSLVIRAIRDYFQPDIGEILIDTDEVYEQARQFMAHVMPGTVNRIKRYRDDVPLFSRFQIEHQIESAYSRQVTLPSGGAIVIDHTEALVSVDVNSGRSTRGADIEETAFKTNLEAAEEVSRQLRLRDLGGLIIIDFIDMESQRNQREVENRLRDGLRLDRARVQTGKISRFGLMELSRQRLRPALAETSYIPCPRCSGTGHIRSAESAALHILRILEEEAMKDNTAAVHTQVPVDVATFLLNEKRADIQAIELRHKVNILLIPNVHLETPQHSIIRLRHDELNLDDLQQPSYRRVDVPSEEATKQAAAAEAKAPRQEAAIKGITSDQPAPIIAEKIKSPDVKAETGLIARILAWFSRKPEPVSPPKPERKPRNNPQRDGQRDGRRGGRNNRRDEEADGREPRASRDPAREPRQTQTARDVNQKPREAKETREPQPRRQRGEPRPERKEQAAIAPVVVEEKNIPENVEKVTEEGSSGGSRRRGRRGGRRDRGERTENPAEVQTSDAALPVAASTDAIVEMLTLPAAEPLAVEAAGEPTTTLVELPVSAEIAIPAPAPQAKPESFEALSAETEALPEPLAFVEKATAEPLTVPAIVAIEPAVDIEKVLETSGLIMVETNGDKIRSWQPEEASSEVAPRPRRKRALAVATQDEPLVMVETNR